MSYWECLRADFPFLGQHMTVMGQRAEKWAVEELTMKEFPGENHTPLPSHELLAHVHQSIP